MLLRTWIHCALVWSFFPIAALGQALPGVNAPPGDQAAITRSSYRADAGSAIASVAPPLSMTLREAVSRALDRNPDVTVARAEIDRAAGLMRSARAAALPTLMGTATYTRLDGDRKLAERIVSPANAFNANVSLSVPILAFTAWTQWGQSKDNIEVARVTEREVRRRVGIAVGQAYIGVLSAKRLSLVEQRALDVARVHAEFVRQRILAGTGRRLDLVRAQQEIATAERLLANSKSAAVKAQEALGVLLGVDAAVDASEVPSDFSVKSQQVEEHATIQNRDDVRAAEVRARVQERVADDSYSEFLPVLNGIFTPFYQNPATLTVPQTGWQAQLVLTIPFYDGGARYGRQDQRRAQLRESRVALERVRRQSASEARAARVAVEQNRAARAAAESAASLALETLELAKQSYEAGVVSELEVIDAERTARDVEAQAAAAEEAELQAELDLLAALGQFP